MSVIFAFSDHIHFSGKENMCFWSSPLSYSWRPCQSFSGQWTIFHPSIQSGQILHWVYFMLFPLTSPPLCLVSSITHTVLIFWSIVQKFYEQVGLCAASRGQEVRPCSCFTACLSNSPTTQWIWRWLFCVWWSQSLICLLHLHCYDFYNRQPTPGNPLTSL